MTHFPTRRASVATGARRVCRLFEVGGQYSQETILVQIYVAIHVDQAAAQVDQEGEVWLGPVLERWESDLEQRQVEFWTRLEE